MSGNVHFSIFHFVIKTNFTEIIQWTSTNVRELFRKTYLKVLTPSLGL